MSYTKPHYKLLQHTTHYAILYYIVKCASSLDSTILYFSILHYSTLRAIPLKAHSTPLVHCILRELDRADQLTKMEKKHSSTHTVTGSDMCGRKQGKYRADQCKEKQALHLTLSLPLDRHVKENQATFKASEMCGRASTRESFTQIDDQ